MTTQTPSGWYPDPYGSPLLRWWDGQQWTDATHQADAPAGQGVPRGPQTGPLLQVSPAGPGVQQPGPPPPPGEPSGTGPTGPWNQQTAQPPNGHTAQMPLPPYVGYPSGPPPRRSGPLPWILGGGGALVLIVVIVVATMYLINPDRRNDAAEPVTPRTPPPAASQDPGQSPSQDPGQAPPSGVRPPQGKLPQPVDGRVTDPVTGLSYEVPEGAWQVPPSAGDGLGFTWNSAVIATAQENFDGRGGNWVGNIVTGELPDQYGYQGVESMRSVAATLLQAVEPNFYSPPHRRKIVEDKAVKVSGKDAWLFVFDLDFSEQSKANDWKWKRERAAFLIVDRGEGNRPALAYLSVPDNLGISAVDKAIKSFKLS